MRLNIQGMPSPEVLRQLLRYEPNTGRLFWLTRPDEMFKAGANGGRQAQAHRWNKMYAGKNALTSRDTYGYHHGPIFGRLHLAHRVIWAMHYGEWPTGKTIDHVNCDRADNRIENLRTATRSENMRNRRILCPNASGYKGVQCRGSRFFATIKVDGKKISLGGYPTPEDAHAAYARASAELHGEFGRAG